MIYQRLTDKAVIINEVILIAKANGVLKIYPCGTTHFISNDYI